MKFKNERYGYSVRLGHYDVMLWRPGWIRTNNYSPLTITKLTNGVGKRKMPTPRKRSEAVKKYVKAIMEAQKKI